METYSSLENSATAEDEEINISTLPQEPSWHVSQNLYQYQGFWCYPNFLKGIFLFQKNFIPQPDVILLSSYPKTGSTWLKSLSISISTRTQFSPSNSLLTKLPHDIVPVQELLYSLGHEMDSQNHLISTHVPFTSLPKSILDSNTKVIYICREPKDVFVSTWHFVAKKKSENAIIPFDEACEKFCNGFSAYGPYWNHVLGYWKASLKFPEKVLFLKYEDLKNDTEFYVKKTAGFMGCPFTVDEEKHGVVENIVKLCNFESLSNLEVNKSKETTSHAPFKIENNAFFRKGEIGDWKNYLTPEMAKRIDEVTREKFGSVGLYL